MDERMQDAFSEQAEELENEYEAGRCTPEEYRRWMRELRYEYEFELAEQAHRAYEAEIGRFQ